MCQPCRRLKRQAMACEVCGGAVSADKVRRRRACSLPCSLELRRRARPPRGRRSRKCEVCESEYRPTCGGQRTCGHRCGRVLARSARRTFTCAACGNVYEGASSARQRFCSDACRPSPVWRVRSCVECGSDVEGSTKTCSARCSASARSRYNRDYNARRPNSDWDRTDRVCPHCDLEFTPTFVGQVYHDQACMNRAKRKRERLDAVDKSTHRINR